MSETVKLLLEALRKLVASMPAEKAAYAEKLRDRIIKAAEAKDEMSLSALAVELDARGEQYGIEWKAALRSLLDSIIKVGLAELLGGLGE